VRRIIQLSFGSTMASVVEGASGEHRPAHVRTFPDGGNNSRHTPGARKNGGRKLMSPLHLFWCGEGDLFSRRVLKAHKLYTLQRRKNTRSSTNTESSHTFSHTARQKASGPPSGAAFVDAFRALPGLRPITGEVNG